MGESERCHYKLGKRNVSSAGRRERGKKKKAAKYKIPRETLKKEKKAKHRGKTSEQSTNGMAGSFPAIHPSAKWAAASPAAAAVKPLCHQRHLRARPRTRAADTRTDTRPHPCTPTQSWGAPPRGSRRVWLCGGGAPGPAPPPGPRVSSDAQLSRGCWNSRSPNPLPRTVSPDPPSRALRFGDFSPPPPSSSARIQRRVKSIPHVASASHLSLCNLPPPSQATQIPQGSPAARRLGKEKDRGCSLSAWKARESPYVQALPRHLFPAGLLALGPWVHVPYPPAHHPATCQVS